MTYKPSDFIAIGSLIVSFVALIYASNAVVFRYCGHFVALENGRKIRI